MPALSVKNPFTGKTHTLGNDQQAQSNPQSGLLSFNWGGAGNEHAISLLNGKQSGGTTSTSLGSYSSGDKTTELLPQTQSGGKTTTALGSYDDGDEKVSLLPTTLSSEGGASIDASLLSAEDDAGASVQIGHANAGYVNKDTGSGGSLSGFQLGGEVMGVQGPGGDMSLGNAHASSIMHEKDGKNEWALDGGASTLDATLVKGDRTDEISGPGFGVTANGGSEGLGLSGGPTIASVASTHSATDAAGQTSSTTGGLDLSEKPGFQLAWGDVGLDGDEEHGGMVNLLGGNGKGGMKGEGDLGLMLNSADVNGDGKQEFNGIDVGVGFGSASATATDADHDGTLESNVGLNVGPVSASSSSEGKESLLESVGGFAKDRVDDVKSLGSKIGGWFGFGD